MITRKIKKTIYNALVICLLLIGLVYVCSRFIHPGVEYTDNAQVRQHITPVNTRVQGFIREIRFEEYSPVRRGDTLLLIEDAEFRLRLAQAEADLANARAVEAAAASGKAAAWNNLGVNDAAIEEARVQLENAAASSRATPNSWSRMPSPARNTTGCALPASLRKPATPSSPAPKALPSLQKTSNPTVWRKAARQSVWQKPPSTLPA